MLLKGGAMNGQVRYDASVKNDLAELSMPWTGGMNAPQFSNIDFNRDGIQDLISFDRQGDILRTYIRMPASGRWIQSWQYEEFFPPLVDWVKIVDFDGDGVEDLFTSSSKEGVAGVTVYKGSFENDTWSFTRLRDRGKNYLQVTVGGGLTNVYVSWDDIPSIDDIDGDGDYDILAFEPGGSYISYFQNQSVDLGWGTDSLRFELTDFCWGKILENELTEEVYLSDTPTECSDGNFTGDDHILPRHSGSTVATLDFDFDGDKDAWVGDITSRHLVHLLNGLNAETAWITAQDANFPSGDTVIEIPYFIAGYFVELDDDPEPELLAAVNSRTLAEDRKSLWRYDDDLADGPLNYKLTQKGWLQDQMIDVGSHSRPAIADITGDGLLDIVMGGYHFTDGAQTRIPSLWLYKNVGTPTYPYFQFVTDDYLSISLFSGNTFDFAPAFGDLNGDDALDLIVGEQNGKLFYFQNTAAAGDSMIFASPLYPYMNINVGVSSTPQIADINGDGLADLLIGERTGNADVNGRCSNLNYFQNIGSIGNPQFNSDINATPNTGCYGRVLFDLQIGLPQYSTPTVFRTKEGLMLMTGNDPGKLLIYDDLQNGITGAITEVDSSYGHLDMGNRSAPVLADLNNDGKYELIVGNQRGGLELLSTEFEVGFVSTKPVTEIEKPYSLIHSTGSIEVVWKNEIGETRVFDVYGRLLETVTKNQTQQIDAGVIVPVIYFIQMSLNGEVWVEKVIMGR